jgi:pilus assembly protein Flp/PilA
LAGRREENQRQPANRSAATVNQEWAMRRLARILRCERGANAIEYALVASLIAIAAIGAYKNLGARVDLMLNNVSNHIG